MGSSVAKKSEDSAGQERLRVCREKWRQKERAEKKRSRGLGSGDRERREKKAEMIIESGKKEESHEVVGV